MEHDRVETDTVEEAQAVRELVNLVKDRSTNFDDGKFRGVGRVRRGGKDSEVAFDFALGANGIEKACNGVL